MEKKSLWKIAGMSCFVRLLVLSLGVEWEETTTIFHKIKLIKHFKMALKMLWFVSISNEFEFSSFYALMRTEMKDEFFSRKELINMLRTVGELSIWRGFTIRSRTFPTLGSSSGSFQLNLNLDTFRTKKTPKNILSLTTNARKASKSLPRTTSITL